MEDDPQLQFAVAEIELSLLPLQTTLGELYERTRFATSNANADGSLSGATDPEVTEYGSIVTLSVENHINPIYDHRSRMRRGMTLRLESLLESEGGPTGTYDIWWKNDPRTESGVFYELRRRKDELEADDTAYTSGVPCYETTVQMLLDLLPCPSATTPEDKKHRLPKKGINPSTIAQRFGALGLNGL